MNFDFDPIQRKLVNGPEAGQNTEVDGFTVSFIGGGTGGTVYNAGAGLTLTGNVFAADVAAVGFGMELQGGTVSYARYRAIETVSGSSVTLQAGHAYKIYATSAAITLNAETIPSGMYGQEGHLEIFVSGTGYVVTGTNVVLANALEPDAVNNCTVRFHDGIAIIAVEDHVAGYIVVNGSTSGDGSLYYGITTSTNDYVAFDASLNGTTIPLAGAVAEGEKHVVGNGYTETILSGGVTCTSKTTFSNLSMDGVVNSGGTMTLGDVNIPNGATVSVSGGNLAIEKVTGNGTIDLNGTFVSCTSNTVEITGTTFNNGSRYCLQMSGAAVRPNLTSCTFGSGTFGVNQGAIWMTGGSAGGANPLIVSGCSFVGNGNYFMMATNAAAVVSSCYLAPAGGIIMNNTTYMKFVDTNLENNSIYTGSGVSIGFSGDCKFGGTFTGGSTRNADVTISSGAIVDLTGNTNTTPIAPGGGVIIDGGCTVINSAGASVSIAGGTYTKINNDGTTE